MGPEIRAHGESHFSKEQLVKWSSKLSEFGYISAPHPEESGGYGMDWKTHLLIWEEVAVGSLDLALTGLITGEKFISIGISEPDVGSDVAAVKTRAVKDGDEWVINGEKTWISNGEHMDIFVCTCKTGEGELTHIAIPADTPGLEVKGIEKMALNSQSTSQIFLADVRVPVANTVGKEGDGLKNTLVTFERARCHMAAWGYSIARRALEESVKYSQERTQHGKQIAGHQLIALKIAKMATEIDAARLLTLRAADMIDNGIRCDKECSMAKW